MAQFFYILVFGPFTNLLVFVEVYPWNPNGEIPVLIGFFLPSFGRVEAPT